MLKISHGDCKLHVHSAAQPTYVQNTCTLLSNGKIQLTTVCSLWKASGIHCSILYLLLYCSYNFVFMVHTVLVRVTTSLASHPHVCMYVRMYMYVYGGSLCSALRL